MLTSLEEVMGRNGLNALLNLIELPQYIQNAPLIIWNANLILPTLATSTAVWKRFTDRVGVVAWPPQRACHLFPRLAPVWRTGWRKRPGV
jgi:hypothetical protein